MDQIYCKICNSEFFTKFGVAKVRGLKFFNCSDCGEHSANYVEGQTNLCHACAEKLGMCAICGRIKNGK